MRPRTRVQVITTHLGCPSAAGRRACWRGPGRYGPGLRNWQGKNGGRERDRCRASANACLGRSGALSAAEKVCPSLSGDGSDGGEDGLEGSLRMGHHRYV